MYHAKVIEARKTLRDADEGLVTIRPKDRKILEQLAAMASDEPPVEVVITPAKPDASTPAPGGPGAVVFGRTATGEDVTAGMIKSSTNPRAVIATIAEWTEAGQEIRALLQAMEWSRLRAVVDAGNPYLAGTAKRSRGAPASEDWRKKVNQIRKAQGSEPI